MGVAKRQSSSSPPYPPPAVMTPPAKVGGRSDGGSGGKDVKQRANFYMNKLCDRDTEAMAAAELESMAMALQPDSLSSFISAVCDTRSSDKAPLRRHCLRLFSLLARTYPREYLTPFLPRMVSSVLRRLRDPDSSIRAACIVAVRDMSGGSGASAFYHIFFKPLSESLLLEQDQNAQTGSALCLAAAIEEASVAADAADDDDPLAAHLRRLIPRLVKLARSESYKSKPALISLLGSIVAANAASTPPMLSLLVPCLADALLSEDWAVRKAAAEALTHVAAIPYRHLLMGFKSSYFSFFQSRKFDKVKIVRDSMNQMLEAWKDVPGAVKEDDDHGNDSDVRRLSAGRISPFSARKERSPASRPPAADSSPTPAARRKASPMREKRTSSLLLCRSDLRRSPPDWKIEIATPIAPARDEAQTKRVLPAGETQETEIRKDPLERNSEQKSSKTGLLKSGSKVVPLQEKENQEEETLEVEEDGDLTLIRKQLVQIENQQSNLLDLVQRFIGNSQNGIRSLETRVHGLERALDEISQDLVVSSGRVDHCCRLPGADFLSSKFWRRAEIRSSSTLLGPTCKDGPSKSTGGLPVNPPADGISR